MNNLIEVTRKTEHVSSFFSLVVPQIPQPTSTPPTTQLSSTATPPKVDAPSAAPSANGGAAGTETNSKKKEKSKAKADKKGKTDDNSGKKKGGGPELPVDVSRLDLRIGRIIRAWKHPDADSLYVEEGEGVANVQHYWKINFKELCCVRDQSICGY